MNKVTWTALTLALALGAANACAEDTALQTPEAAQTSPQTQQLGDRILMRGLEGEDVKQMQGRLYELGYYLGEVDGVFGLQTQSAVRAFQRAHKLQKIDGKAGPETLGRMFAEDAIVQPTPTPTATPAPTPTPVPTPSPTPSPIPTPKPDMENAPFAMEEMELYVADKPVTLIVGRDEAGEVLYPMCGTLSHMGYTYTYAAGSWQLMRELDGAEIALMAAGENGLCEGAMGAFGGVVFLADEKARVYVYDGEAYVTAEMLAHMQVSVLMVKETPVLR